MPTYEYVCTGCNHRFERVQKFSDAPVSECPECSAAVRKVYFAAGVVFKGSGWYINDSRPSAPSESSGSSNASSGAATPSADPSPGAASATPAAASAETKSTAAPAPAAAVPASA